MPFLADLAVMGAFYRAKNKPATFALFTSYLQPSLLLGMAAIAVWAGSGVTMFVLASTLAAIASSVAVLHDYRRRFPGRSSAPARLFAQWQEISRILRESLWMALNLLTYGLMRAADILILGFFVPAREVGAYGVLTAISTLVQTYPLAMSQTLGPQIARLHHARDLDGIKVLLSEHVARASIVGSFVFGGIAGFGSYLDLVFGSSFAFSPLLALLLPAGWLVSAVLAPTSLALSMAGAHRQDLAYLLIGTSVLLFGCFLFIPLFGTAGAAASSLAAFITVNGLRFATVCRLLGSVPGRPKDLIAPFLGLGLSSAIAFVIDISGVRSFLMLLLGCIAYTAAFAAMTYFLLLTDAERSFVGGFAAKLRGGGRL
jgi:O-antigen/teichoic acid export membrane protein